MRTGSVTFRLTLFFSAASTVVLLAVGTMVGTLVESHFIEEDLKALDNKTEFLRRTMAKVKSRSELDQVPQLIDDALAGHSGLSITVVGPEGRVFFASSDSVFADAPIEDRLEKGLADPRATMVLESGGHAYREIAAVLPTGISGKPPARALLSVNIDHQREFMAVFRRILWLSIAAGILLTGVFAWIAARRGLDPLRRIVRLARGVSASRLGNRLSLDAVPSELADLASAFNAMLDRLEDSFRRLSNFSSDLAHELRTPVGNLITETEVELSRARSADEYREVLYSNLEEYQRLSRMIEDMLYLARADNGLIVPLREEVDLAAETDALFAYYDALAEETGVGMVREGAGTICGDRLMIRRALSNLLSNALRYSLRGDCVKVRIAPLDSGGTGLAIENPAPDIPADQLSRLFDRFYRVDASRHSASGGTGLGLSITKSIVEAHQGTIGAFSTNGTVRFEVRFPAPSAPEPRRRPE